MAAHPGVADAGNVAPVASVVGHVIDDDGRPPVGAAIDVDPFAGGGQVTVADGWRGHANGFGDGRYPPDQELGPAAVPRVKGILGRTVEGQRIGGQHARVRPDALAHTRDGCAPQVCAHGCAAPPHTHGRRTRVDDVYTKRGVGLDNDSTGGCLKGEIRLATREPVYVEGALPAANGAVGRQADDFRFAAVGHAQEGAARELDFGRATAIDPQRVAGQDERIDGGLAPVTGLRTFDHCAAFVEAHASVHEEFFAQGRACKSHSANE